jgi:hypothetical protein
MRISSRPHHRPLNRISLQARKKAWNRKAMGILGKAYSTMVRDGNIDIICGSREEAQRVSRERIAPQLVNLTSEAVDITEINPALEAKMWIGLLDYLEYRFSYFGTAKVTLTLGRIGQAIFAHDPDDEERLLLQNFLSRFVRPRGNRGNSWFGDSFDGAYQVTQEQIRCRVTNAVDHVYTFIKWEAAQ